MLFAQDLWYGLGIQKHFNVLLIEPHAFTVSLCKNRNDCRRGIRLRMQGRFGPSVWLRTVLFVISYSKKVKVCSGRAGQMSFCAQYCLSIKIAELSFRLDID